MTTIRKNVAPTNVFDIKIIADSHLFRTHYQSTLEKEFHNAYPYFHAVDGLCVYIAQYMLYIEKIQTTENTHTTTTYFIPYDQTLYCFLTLFCTTYTRASITKPFTITVAGQRLSTLDQCKTYMTHLQNRVITNASFWCNRVKITHHQRHLPMYARIGELLEHVLGDITTTNTNTNTNDTSSTPTPTPNHDHYHQINSNKVFANPVTLNLRLLVQLNYSDYYIAPKVDGERHLLWIRHNQVFLLNRACTHLRAIGQCDEWLPWHDSVFDVECISSLSQSVQQKIILFDVLRLQSVPLHKHPFVERKQEIEFFLRAVRNASSYFQIQQYLDFDKVNIQSPTLTTQAPTDGWMFVHRYEPYRTGYRTSSTRTPIIKWKPPELNTIDLEVLSPSHVGIRHSNFHFPLINSKLPPPSIGSIVECRIHIRMSCATIEYRAEIIRVRHDRQYPNALWVAQSIFDSICENITCDLLQQNVDLCIRNNNTNANTDHSDNMDTTHSRIPYGRSIMCQT